MTTALMEHEKETKEQFHMACQDLVFAGVHAAMDQSTYNPNPYSQANQFMEWYYWNLGHEAGLKLNNEIMINWHSKIGGK